MNKIRVAVTSRSFSKNAILRDKLLKKYSDVKFNDEGTNLQGENLINFLKGHTHAIVALENINEMIISKLPELEVISKYGVGLNNLEFNSLIKYHKKVAWASGVNKNSVAELALWAMLGLAKRTFDSSLQLKQKKWAPVQGHDLNTKTIGIIGLGNVGKKLVKILSGLNCNILVHDINIDTKFCHDFNLKIVEKEELLSKADIVSLHLPLYHQTHHYLNSENLKLLKNDCIIINTSRGGIINEDDLFQFLKDHPEATSFSDVFENEPPKNWDLISLPNFYGTPHIGGSTIESVLKMGEAAIQGLETARILNTEEIKNLI